MKKLILVLMLGMVAIGLQAQNFVARDFLQGNQAVFVTNNTTFSYGENLIPYTNTMGAAVYSGVGRYSTNGLLTPGTYATNSYVSYPPAWGDVLSGSDRDGNNLSACIAVSLVGTSTSTTQAVAFTFAKLVNMTSPGLASTPGTETIDKFIFAVTPNGTTTVTLATNVPTAVAQGAAGWRLISVAEPNNAAEGGLMIKQVTLNHYQP